jgi:pyruvate-formate lyase-activating enzyme
VHCYASAGPYVPLFEGLSTADWLTLLREAHTEGCESVSFIGGEPLLHPELEHLLRTARSLGYNEIEVFTNGTRLTPKWLTLFDELKVKLAFSFYATEPQGHNAITGVGGSYQRTLRGIDLALSAGLRVRVGVIRVTQTDEEVEHVINFLKARGVSTVGVDRVRAIGRADEADSHTAPSKQLAELCGACHDGKLCVTATGEAYPCIMARAWPVGNIRDGLQGVLRGQYLTRFRQRQREFLANSPTASCNPDDCNPYCNPNCKPFEGCSPKCFPW